MPNIEYNRPNGRKQYISIAKHQSNSINKYSKWESINIEKETFDNADYGNFNHQVGNTDWSDDDGNLWGVQKNLNYIGTKKEQFGFFPKPSNQNDRWHGYPTFNLKKLSNQLLECWSENNIIDSDDIPSILRLKKV